MKVLMIGHGAFAQKHMDGIDKIDGAKWSPFAVAAMKPPKPPQKRAVLPTGALTWMSVWPRILTAPLSPLPPRSTPNRPSNAWKPASTWKWKFPWPIPSKTHAPFALPQEKSGLVAMAGHTRRFNPSHQWIHNKITAGELNILQMDVQTYFFRRTNMNAAGEPRSWVDHLLWHHACHTVDLFQYQTGEVVSECFALEGPHHPELGIAMDMSIGMKVPSGAICTLSLSFNNDGPLGTYFRYIGDNGTYLARYDDLFTGAGRTD